MRIQLKVVAILVLAMGLIAQGSVFAGALAPSCFLPAMGCQMSNCSMAKSMPIGGQKMDCCKLDAEKGRHSDALPAAPKSGTIQGAEFTHQALAHFGVEPVVSPAIPEFIEYESPHTPEPLYEKNQDLRL